jgi:hypothetical protein
VVTTCSPYSYHKIMSSNIIKENGSHLFLCGEDGVFSVRWKEIFEVIYELRKETHIGSHFCPSVTCYDRLNRRKFSRLSWNKYGQVDFHPHWSTTWDWLTEDHKRTLSRVAHGYLQTFSEIWYRSFALSVLGQCQILATFTPRKP